MTGFTVRVELHDADDDDYEELHEAMEKEGFERTIVGESGTTYRLPTAEYRYYSDTESRGDVRNKAYDIAKKIKSKPWVLVTEGPSCWRGLEEED